MKYRVLLVPLAVVALLGTACTGNGARSATRSPRAAASTSATASRAIGAAANGCAAQPPITALPVWAQGGFSPPDWAVPHVMGAAGNIVAVLWAPKNALHAPPLAHQNNKILWVSKVLDTSAAPLVIHATLAGGTRTATVTVPGGPGPSTVNLPVAGCWTLRLSWGRYSDRMMLRYTA